MDPIKTLKTMVSILIVISLLGVDIGKILNSELLIGLILIIGFISLAYFYEEGKEGTK